MSIPGQKSLIVSLHDAHPASHERIAGQIRFLAELGVVRTSILVVPEFHHEVPMARDAGFRAAVTDWQSAGHEIVLHGYFHDRKESPPEKLSTLFWTRLYTSQEAEFLDLPPEEARARIERGRALFAARGWEPRGFVAPAWLMAPGLTGLLDELGFAYTTRVGGIIGLGSRAGASRSSRSLCYSARAAWRRTASLGWNRWLFGRLRRSDLIRLSLHPRDLEFSALREQIGAIVHESLRCGFVPTTYADYVAG